MKTGLEEIIFQREEKQIKKHGFTGAHHANHPEWYADRQLVVASRIICKMDLSYDRNFPPLNWNSDWWKKLCDKGYKERLSISASFLASEIDRLNELEKRNNGNI